MNNKNIDELLSTIGVAKIDIDKIEESLLDEMTDPNSKANRAIDKHKSVTIQEILKRADEAEIREDVFLQSVCIELQAKRERLRHRADMMRRRAEEFDVMADELGNTEEGVKDYVFRLMHHIQEIEELLARHAHIEPQKT